MARKPNYDFERRERERIKAAKLAQKAEAKRLQRERDRADQDPAPGDAVGPTEEE